MAEKSTQGTGITATFKAMNGTAVGAKYSKPPQTDGWLKSVALLVLSHNAKRHTRCGVNSSFNLKIKALEFRGRLDRYIIQDA